MKGLPCSLLGRTTLYLGVLMFISQALWFCSAKFFLVHRLRQTYEQQIGDVVAMAQALIETRSNEAALTPANFAPFSSFESLKIMSDAEPRPAFDADRDENFPPDLVDALKKKLGPSFLIQKQKDKSIIWMRFAARGNLFWLVLPLNRPTILPYSVLFWVGMGLAISVAGAYLIIFRLTQQLRKVTEAAQAVGRGEPPAPLEERGPQEIRDLSVGFNEMASDLKKLDSDRRLMLAGISHDLRTPLTHLRIAVELAAANAEPTIAAGMVHDIEDMDSILKQFLDYARDGSEEPFEESDLDAIVQEVSHRYTARGHPVKIELGKIPPFPFRRLAMRRVITNLVDNAVRYGRAGVRVKTRCTKATVTVVVSDEGPGIRTGNPADFLKPFAREDISRSESGAGLGLAIVDRAVRLHGGRLRLENQKPTGLLALIELPLTRTSMNLT